MYQPEAKLAFVQRYCNPSLGWEVFVDIDPSEEGRTVGERRNEAARLRQKEMVSSADKAGGELEALNVQVGGSRAQWMAAIQDAYPAFAFPVIPGDRDIVAIHPQQKLLLVAEVEGVSSGQPETKLYKAIGQAVVGGTGEA